MESLRGQKNSIKAYYWQFYPSPSVLKICIIREDWKKALNHQNKYENEEDQNHYWIKMKLTLKKRTTLFQ